MLNDLKERSGPIYAMIEERTGEIVTEARHEIIATPRPHKTANARRLRTGASAVRVIRRYLDVTGRPMLTSINWHRRTWSSIYSPFAALLTTNPFL